MKVHPSSEIVKPGFDAVPRVVVAGKGQQVAGRGAIFACLLYHSIAV